MTLIGWLRRQPNPPVIEQTGEEKWEWDARRNYMKVVNGVDIGEWPYEKLTAVVFYYNFPEE